MTDPQYSHTPTTPPAPPTQLYQPPRPQKKNAKRWLWFVAAVVILLFSGCVGFAIGSEDVAGTVPTTVRVPVSTVARRGLTSGLPQNGA